MSRIPLLSVVLLASCFAARPLPPYAPNLGPPVSATCLDAARRGTLVRNAPASVGAYRVTRPEPGVLYLRRQGRALSAAEGEATFRAFRATGMSSGASGIFSTHGCPDVPRASCLSYRMWLCQTSLERVARELDAALTAAGAPDGELALNLTVLEARGPRCNGNAPCPIQRHYGSPKGEYDPDEARIPLRGGQGECARDADCDGPGNECAAWYLQGGLENAIYVQWSVPTFCGCIQGACSWFSQEPP